MTGTTNSSTQQDLDGRVGTHVLNFLSGEDLADHADNLDDTETVLEVFFSEGDDGMAELLGVEQNFEEEETLISGEVVAVEDFEYVAYDEFPYWRIDIYSPADSTPANLHLLPTDTLSAQQYSPQFVFGSDSPATSGFEFTFDSQEHLPPLPAPPPPFSPVHQAQGFFIPGCSDCRSNARALFSVNLCNMPDEAARKIIIDRMWAHLYLEHNLLFDNSNETLPLED